MSHDWQPVFTYAQNKKWFQYFTRLVVGLALLLYVALGIQTELASLVSQPIPATLMSDFRIYVEAYTRAAQGADPYTMGTIGQAFLYPAPTLLLIGLLTTLPSEPFRNAFFIALNLGLVCLILRGIAARYTDRTGLVWWWFPLAFGFAPILETLHIGQINIITLFGAFLMLVYADALPMVGGLGLALAIITKVTPVFLFVYLVVTRSYRAIVWACVFLVAASVASVFCFGFNVVMEYPRVFNYMAQSFIPGAPSQSLVTLLHQNGWLEGGAWFLVQQFLNVYLAAIFIVSTLVAWVSRRHEPAFLIVALGTAVMPNVMWYHHYVFILLPVFVWLAWSRFHPAIVLWCFAGLTLIQIDRDLLARGLVSHLFVHSSILGILVWQLAHASKTQVHRWWAVLAGLAAIALIALIPFQQILLANRNLATARTWIEQNLPAGSRLAMESRLLLVDPERYTLQEVTNITDQLPEWYARNGFEYLVFRPGTWQDSTRSGALFARFSQAARFENGSFAILVLKTNVTDLPSRRAAAHFGLYGEWLEFVGYDLQLPQVVLYWRAVEARRESLQLTVRLLDRLDQEIARSSGALFGVTDAGGRWREGLTHVGWTLAAPIEPGMYRLELNVEAEGQGRVPVLSRTGEPLSDKLFLGPFRIAPAPPSADELRRARPADIWFGDLISLQSYRLPDRALHPGEEAAVTLYWKSETKTERDLTVFVHLLDVNGNVRAQLDAQPRGGAYPTSLWDTDEIVRDDYRVTLPHNLVPGDYSIVVGLYEYPALTRLMARDASGALLGSQFLLRETIRIAQ